MPNFRSSVTILNELATPAPDVILDLISFRPQVYSVDLTWTPPNLNGTTFLFYEIQQKKCNDVAFRTIATVTDASFTALGLESESCYDFRVKTVSVEGSSAYGNVTQNETTPDLPLFTTPYAFFAVADITSVFLVAIEDTVIEQNGVLLVNLTAGQTFTGVASQFDQFTGTGAFNAMGLISNDWFALNPNYTVGKTFAYGAIRNNPQTVSVYAFQDAMLTITVGGNAEHSVNMVAGTGQNFSFTSTNENILIESDGLVMASKTSNGNIDQNVLLPASTSVIGFPSSRARVYPTQNNTIWGAFRSSGVPYGGGGHWDTSQDAATAGNTGNGFEGDSVYIRADKPVAAQSFADGDGGKSTPFLPTYLMATHFAIPFLVEFVVFASNQAFVVRTSNGNTYSSMGVGNAHKLRITVTADVQSGTMFYSDVPVAAYSEPETEDQDEFVLFGFIL